MAPTLTFGTLRFIIVSLAIFAQIYLFVRFGRAIRSSGRSRRFKIIAVILAGAAIISLFAMNGFILSSPFTRMDLSPAAGFVLFYLPAIWVIGSILWPCFC